MTKSLSIPAFIELENIEEIDESVGEPASVVNNIVNNIMKKSGQKIRELLINENDLVNCIDSIVNIYGFVQKKISEDHPEIKLDSFDFQLGISATGGIAIMGPSFNANVSSALRIILKSK